MTVERAVAIATTRGYPLAAPVRPQLNAALGRTSWRQIAEQWTSVSLLSTIRRCLYLFRVLEMIALDYGGIAAVYGLTNSRIRSSRRKRVL